MDEKYFITASVTIFVAFFSFVAKYYNDLRIAKRKDRLERINRQLKELYGPLLSLTSSSKATWTEFRKKYRTDSNQYHDIKNTPSEKEKEIWRVWVLNVFYPNSEKIFNLIIENGDLIIEDEFPEILEMLCSHVESYKPVIVKWKENDFSEHISVIAYPEDIYMNML